MADRFSSGEIPEADAIEQDAPVEDDPVEAPDDANGAGSRTDADPADIAEQLIDASDDESYLMGSDDPSPERPSQ